MIASGEISPDVLVWSKELNNWVPARSLPIFSAACRPPAGGPPPLPPPPPAVPVAPPVAPPVASAAGPSLLRRALAEAGATVTTSAAHAVRPLLYFRGRWRERSLRRQEEEARLTLGKRLYKNHAGDADLIARIDALKTESRAASANRAAAARCEAQRRRLLLRLADPLLESGDGPPGINDDRAAVRAARERLAAHRKSLAELRASLRPRGGTTWRRLGVTAAVIGTALIVFVLWPSRRPDPPPAPPPAQATGPAPELTVQEVVAHSEKSVALIRGDTGLGTGFLVRKGVLATNAHVIRMSPIDRLNIYFPSAGPDGKKPRSAKGLLYEDLKRDIAFLRVDSDAPPLPVAPEEDTARGQTIIVIGNPGVASDVILENAVSQGIMSTRLKTPDALDYYQLSVAVNPGNSGGPVLDNHGRVLGVVTLKARQEGVAFCIPCRQLDSAADLAEGLAPRRVADIQSNHDAQAVCRRLDLAGGLQLDALSAYHREASAGVREGRTEAEGIRKAAADLREPLKKRSQILVTDMQAAAARVAADTSLPEDVRQRLAALWELYKELKGLAESPPNTLAALDSKTREVGRKYGLLVRGLEARLGIEAEE
jgi:S1-C subfamily serine protease